MSCIACCAYAHAAVLSGSAFLLACWLACSLGRHLRNIDDIGNARLSVCLSVLQPHPASAAAAAVLVAHASSLGPGTDSNTKYNADGTFAPGLDQAEQGQGYRSSPLGHGQGGPLGQGMDVITQGPAVEMPTHKPVCLVVTII